MTQLISLIVSRLESAREDDRGATMVEYGMLVALIAAIAIPAVLALGPEVRDAFQAVVDAIP